MTPKPEQERIGSKEVNDKGTNDVSPESRDEHIVISGMSGLYPCSHNIKEFSDMLYNKVNPLYNADQRWTFSHHEVAQYCGTVPDLDQFDAQFFKIHFRLGHAMDPMSRKLLEQAFQAIYDAGLSPSQLDGKKVGVYIASTLSESEATQIYAKDKYGFGLPGCSKTMFANRISYWLNAKGPSMAIDDSGCSGMAALEQAYHAIKRGDCEAAIVGSGSLCLLPHTSLHYSRIINQSKDGKTKCFDEHANGCVFSEAINVLFLQKAKDALRIYSSIVHVRTEYISLLSGDFGPKYGFNRDPSQVARFLDTFYDDAMVLPAKVAYLEATGSGDPEAEKLELEAIEKVFCENRIDPLMIGSVVSNIGYSEAAIEITAITKVLLGYHKGEIAPNLHCDTPRKDIKALQDGRMYVVTEREPFRRNFAAVNSSSITGLNAHLLLQGHYKPKINGRYKSSIPHLVTLSGRQESSVQKIIDDLKSRCVDPEEIALLHNIHKSPIPNHLGRGFVILSTNDDQKTVSINEKVDYFDDGRRPLWFVYSGMGSQWPGMGKQFMRIPIFAAAIERCNKVLAPNGIDIVGIITSPEEHIFDNILNAFVGIAAVQIGLTDVLRECGIVPDNIIGHSVGELGCAYADGCMTAEEMIMAAKSRGQISLDTLFIKGAMAAVGLGYQKIKDICPPEIEVACHNGPESCTLSGPAEAMKRFVAELTSRGVFAKEVPCSNIAYHSRYISQAGPGLMKLLSEILKKPKPRSERWLSTSVPQEQWDKPFAKTCSAEYLTNNLLSPVLFEETSKLIPPNAVLVEVAPHGLLQAILKRSLPNGCRNIPLARRGNEDNTVLLLEAIGQLYLEGYHPNLQVLYPKVDFPVSTETPQLSHLINWAHEEKWFLTQYGATDRRSAAICNFVITYYEDEYKYLQGNFVNGQTVFPFAGALIAVWDTLSMSENEPKRQKSVHFTDVHLFAQPVLHDRRQLKLNINIERGTGRFEVSDDIAKVATGYINLVHSNTSKVQQKVSTEKDIFTIDSNEIYEYFFEKNYNYSGDFRSIHSANDSLSQARMLWKDNWVTLLDGLIQLNVLRREHFFVSQPTYIGNIFIDTKHILRNETLIHTEVDEINGRTRCENVIILERIQFRDLNPSLDHKIDLKQLAPKQSSHQHIPVDNGENTKLHIAREGYQSTLLWKRVPYKIDKEKIRVHVHYAGLTNKDVRKTIDRRVCHTDDSLSYCGMDFSGITDEGERVMGLVEDGAVSTQVCAEPALLWPVPVHWSLEDAATIPLAYAQAFYCLTLKSHVCPGKRVLIHGGAEARGQAAISVALALGCEVFATVSDIKKKQFLLKLFPELKESHIGNSCEASFEDVIMEETNGNGCDVIISNVSKELKYATLRCTGLNGRMIDLEQLENLENFEYTMYNMTKERSYTLADFSNIFEETTRNHLHRQISEGIANGSVRPLSRLVYEAHDAARAFSLLSSCQHRGRVLLSLQDLLLLVPPRLIHNPQFSHVIVCESSLHAGIRLGDRLISRGAEKVIIHSQHQNLYLHRKIKAWRQKNIEVEVSLYQRLDDLASIERFLVKCTEIGPIEGIYVITNECKDTNETSLMEMLDYVSQKLSPNLKHFALIGSRKKSSEKAILHRAQKGLPAMMLFLSNSEKVTTQNVSSYTNIPTAQQIVDATEQALLSSCPVLEAQLSWPQKLSLLQQVAATADIVIDSKSKGNSTLRDFGINDKKCAGVHFLLRDHYNIYIDRESIPDLTLERLRVMDEEVQYSDYNNTKGLHALISYVDPDELQATAEFVSMTTLTHLVSTADEQFDVSESYLCIIPGIEGNHAKFTKLCAGLKINAITLQPGLDRLFETVEESAQRYAKTLLDKGIVKEDFYLLGYKSGIYEALEVAAILETRGLTGTVFCIGCAPSELQQTLNEHLSAFPNDKLLQDGILRHMFALMNDSESGILDKVIAGVSDWSHKLELTVQTLLGCVKQSAQYTHGVIEAALARVVRSRNYCLPVKPLGSRLVLLRAALAQKRSPLSTLQSHSLQPVIAYQLMAPFAHVVEDLRCSAIINKHLSSKILESFESKNRCETYVVHKSN